MFEKFLLFFYLQILDYYYYNIKKEKKKITLFLKICCSKSRENLKLKPSLENMKNSTIINMFGISKTIKKFFTTEAISRNI